MIIKQISNRANYDKNTGFRGLNPNGTTKKAEKLTGV